MKLWDHQLRGVEGVRDAVARGVRRIALTSPTGMGKTATVGRLVELDLAAGLRVSLYTNRRMLLDQAKKVFGEFGLSPGIRAAGHHPELHKPFQISSLQTEHARTHKAEVWDLHLADRVYFDEGHLFVNDSAARLAGKHLAHEECVLVYVTATPIGLGNVCDELVVAGNTSEGRKCGALVPAYHYGPSEPFIPRGVANATLERGEDITEKQAKKLVMTKGIFGRVFEWYDKLNPARTPTILFAPGVEESRWFAKQFTERGISAAHIDGDYIWSGGAEYKSDREARDAILEDSKNGRVRVLCNRFVLREGIDAPWLSHGILATIFGSLQSYLQAGGRLLRSHPSLERVTIQDHGGNWHRHGSLNSDRHWDLTATPAMIAGERLERMRNKTDPEPIVCPGCKCVLGRLIPGRPCPECGFVFEPGAKRSRQVVMEDGSLSELTGEIYLPKVRRDAPDAQKKWVKVYFRAKNSANMMTFRQAEALFFQDNGYWPLNNLKFMPRTTRGWYLRVADVDPKDLYS